eukprot:PITA_09012
MALYGYHQPSITSYLRENSMFQAVEDHIEHQQQVLQLLKDNLTLPQNRMKQHAYQHRSKRSFDVGDSVLQKIGTKKYKLELLATSRVHPIFHVSGLTKVIGDKLSAETILLELDEEGKIILEPEAVKEIRTRQLQNRSISEYLIKWMNLPLEYSTWEDENFIQKHPELLKR